MQKNRLWRVGLIVGIALLSCLSVSLGAFPAVQAPGPAGATHDSGPATGASVHPLIIPGNYVTFSCINGVIVIPYHGQMITYCSEQNITADYCDTSPACVVGISGLGLNGHNFAGWSVSGSASVQDPTSSLTTFTIDVPNPANHYNSMLTLDLT